MIILFIAFIGRIIAKCAKYFIIGFIALCFLCGCSSKEAATSPAEDIKYAELHEEFFFQIRPDIDSIGTNMEYNIQYFADVRGDAALTAKMNQTIIDSVFFGYHTSTVFTHSDVLPAGFTEMSDITDIVKMHALTFHTFALLDEGWEGLYHIVEAEMDEDWCYYPWFGCMETQFLEPYKNYLSYGIDSYEYTDGAHGNEYYVPVVFNLETGDVVKIEDIVPAENMERLIELLGEATYSNNPEDSEYHESIGYDSDELPLYFTIDSYGITWYTQPYEYGPWVIPFALTWDQLRGVVFDELLP